MSQEISGWLRVDCGRHTRPWSPASGYWIQPPTADYQCICGWSDSASGDVVATFVRTVRHAHRAVCPREQQMAHLPQDRIAAGLSGERIDR